MLPDNLDEAALNHVYIVKGDPASEVILRRATVARAHSVVILSDDRQDQHADGRTIVYCIAVKNVFLPDRTALKACLLIGLYRGETMMLNPVGGEAGPCAKAMT